MSRQLPRNFYLRPNVVEIARELLGKILVTKIAGVRTSGLIVETEAYRGPDDKACHAFDYRRTTRTEPLYAIGGTAYIYLVYGLHHLFNVVTGKVNQPHAVLVRALEPFENVEEMCTRRNFSVRNYRLTSGPGSLSVAMGMTKAWTGMDIVKPHTPISIEDHGWSYSDHEILTGPRVGVAYAEECASWPWRFRVKNNPWTSKPNRVDYA